MRIIGDYHMHTKASDGRASAVEMAVTAREKGLSEIAITDHGFKKSHGLRVKKFEKYRSEVEAAREIIPTLLGAELNIIDTAGNVDLSPKLAGNFDIILMGVHVNLFYSAGSFFTFLLPNLLWKFLRFTPKNRVRKNTEVVKRCLQGNKIDIWTHPGRYFKVDVVEIAKICVEKNILIELNNKKISFRQIDFERMAALGAKFIIGSDAHAPYQIGETDRVFEFLKDCDYKEDSIINLKKTYTEYLNEQKLSGRSQERNNESKKSARRK